MYSGFLELGRRSLYMSFLSQALLPLVTCPRSNSDSSSSNTEEVRSVMPTRAQLEDKGMQDLVRMALECCLGTWYPKTIPKPVYEGINLNAILFPFMHITIHNAAPITNLLPLTCAVILQYADNSTYPQHKDAASFATSTAPDSRDTTIINAYITIQELLLPHPLTFA